MCNTPGVVTDATADIAWLLLLGVARRAFEGERIVRTGEFRTMGWGPGILLGNALSPMIDNVTQPRPYGALRKAKAE